MTTKKAIEFTKMVEKQNLLLHEIHTSNNKLDEIISNANGINLHIDKYHIFNTDDLYILAEALKTEIHQERMFLYFFYNGIKYFTCVN